MRQIRRARWVVLTAFVVVAAACADSDTNVDGVGSSEPAAGEWTRHTLGTVADDREIVGTPFGDGIAVLSVEEPGNVRGFLLDADGMVEEASVDAGSSEFRLITAIADGPNGLVATGNDIASDLYRSFVLTSSDGRTWTEPSTTGFDVPMDVFDLAATDERYIAVGALRTAENPREGGFVPTVLTSDDGTTWSSAQIPQSERGSIRSVVSLDTGLYATGQVDGSRVMWSSTDGGTTWKPVAEAPSADTIVTNGGTALAIKSDLGDFSVHRSDDGGRSWRTLDIGFADELGFAMFFGDRAGFSIHVTENNLEPRTAQDVEACYADIAACSSPPSGNGESVLMSADGDGWSTVDLDTLSGLFRTGSIVHNESGDTVVLGTTDDGEWAAWIWDSAHGAVPTRSDDAPADVPEYDGPPIVESGATLETGVRYAFPIGLHCGMDHLGAFNGVQWTLVESPTGENPETGAGDPVPADWPSSNAGVLGYVTLISDTRIEYSLEDGEVIGVYGPLPAGTVPGPCA